MLRYLQRMMEENPAVPPYEREYYKRLNAKVWPPVVDFTSADWVVNETPTSSSYHVWENEIWGDLEVGDSLGVQYVPAAAFFAADQSFRIIFHFNIIKYNPDGGGGFFWLSGGGFARWYVLYMFKPGTDAWIEMKMTTLIPDTSDDRFSVDENTDHFAEVVVDKSIGANGRFTLNLYNRFLGLLETRYLDLDGDGDIDQIDFSVAGHSSGSNNMEVKFSHLYMETF